MQDQDLTALEGIGKQTVKKLREAGIQTILGLATASIGRLTAGGIGRDTALKIWTMPLARCEAQHRWAPEKELIQEYQSRQYLTSRTKELDRVLGGRGFETGKV